MAKSSINYEDEFTVEDETALSRLEERDRASKVSSGDIYKTGAYAGMMLPSAGIADYFGQYPNPEKAGAFLPSFDTNVNKGEYFDAAMQFLGAAGDASYTIPTIGTVTGTGLKALALGGKLSKVQLNKLMEGIGAFMTKTNDPMLAVSGSPNVNMGSSITKMEGTSSGGGPQSKKATDDIDLGSGSLFAPQSKKGRQLLVLSCSSTKCPDVGDMKAVDRYLGPIFQSLKKQGVPDNVDVAILSAKHGLIRADTKIKDYDQLMDTNRASEFKQDAGQMDRIKNTLDGYDKVVVQGGKNYKDVIRAASGDANVTEIPGGRGIGDQRKSVKSALAFSKIDTPVYHFSQNIDPGFTKFDPDKAPAALDSLGIHVGSTPKAAEDRFMDLTFGFGGRETRRSIAKEKGVDYDTALSYMELPKVSGNVGYEKIGSGQFSLPIPRKSLGGSIPLKADLSKPYLPKGNYKYSQDSKQWQESEITDHLLDKYNDDRGKTFTMQHLVGDKPNFPFGDFRKFIGEFRKDLAKDGFTHLPYYNDVEDAASTSYIMLTDRPKGSTKVLQSPFAKKDPDKFDDPDFMMEEGGVVSMKDKAININRGPRGIEPFVQYFENGGAVNYGMQRVEAAKMKDAVFGDLSKRFNRIMRRGIEYEYGGPFDPTLKENIDDYYVLPDDPVVKPPPPTSTYRSGVEFGDVELGMDLLNKMKFNPTLQAGLRDDRSLTDYVKYIKPKDVLGRAVMRGAVGSYSPKPNIIFMKALNTLDYPGFDDTNEKTLVHELMHKGAELLRRDKNVDLSFLKDKLESRSSVIRNESKEIKAEHRYLQAIVNTAYMDQRIEKARAPYLKEKVRLEKRIKELSGGGENFDFLKKFAEDNLRNNEIGLRVAGVGELLNETNRVFKLYFPPSLREKFLKDVKKIIPFETTESGDRLLVQDEIYKLNIDEAKAVYELANTLMAHETAAKAYKEQIEKGKTSRLTEDYPIYFPDQTYTFKDGQVMDEIDSYIEKKEGGVIGLKDKAVNMYRNRL